MKGRGAMKNREYHEGTSELEADGLRVKVTRRSFIVGVGLVGASLVLGGCSGASGGNAGSASGDSNAGNASSATSQASPMLAIIHTNDTHGHDVETAAEGDTKGNFSMAAVAALKADWKAKGYEVILLDAGDATQGTPLVDTSNGAPAIAFMNSCGYELMTVGNHEFDWGADALAENEKQANFPFISANVLRKDTGELRFAPNKVIELADGTKVGFFGLTAPDTSTSTNPKNVADLTFLADKDLYACAQEQVDTLRKQGCDLIVCVGHLGNKSAARGNGSRALLENVTGIDLFIDGHDHDEVKEEVNGTLLVETGCYLHNIGVVAIDKGAPVETPIAYGGYDGKDAATQAIIDDEDTRVKEQMAVVLAHTPIALDGERGHVRASETNLGDLMADAYKWTASQELGRDVDAGLMNGGGIRASFEAGDITLGEVKTVLPFSNDLVVIEVTGAQLLEAFEAACQAVGAEKGIGAFPQVSGITFSVDASVPYQEGPTYPDTTIVSPAAPGTRVTIVDVGGRGFDANTTYAIATISFLASGGDTYYAFKTASDAKTPTAFGFDYEAIVSYLTVACNHEVPDQYAAAQGRITINGTS